MDPIIVIILAIAGLLGGLAIGWILGGKSAKASGEGTTEALRLQVDGLKEERDGIAAERAALRERVEGLRDEKARVDSELSAFRAGAEEREKAFAVSLEKMESRFGELSGKVLGEAQRHFLERADQRFNQQGEKTEERIKQLLSPVGERLKAYEDHVGRIEKERVAGFADLKGLIGEMKEGQARVSTEAARLVNSLRNAPKARGRWGEQQLKNVLESCGLSEHVDFVTEQSVTDSDGARLRPDAIVRTPGGKNLVIDAKVSLNDYQDAFEAEDEAGRHVAMDRHTRSMKTHIEGLSRKAYWDQFEDAPDYVIMFVPGEHFLSAALEHEPQLWDYAFERKVLLATPTNLVAIARTVASVWRQEKMADEARVIGQLGKEMYDRLATAAEHLKRVGSGLNSAVGNYNKFVGSFERNVLATGRRFKELNVETGRKELEIVEEVEALPRYGADEEAGDAPQLSDERESD